MKNKKGFTLIELLVVIVIMTSILIFAIVSINKISDNNKQQAYETTQKQVVTAAKEYFDSNQYIYSTLDEGAYMMISVGTLVKEDYINIVVDPTNAKKVSYCDYVKVQKDDNENLIFEYQKNMDPAKTSEIDCGNKSSIVIATSPSSPLIEATAMFNDKYTGVETIASNKWANNDVNVNLNVTFKRHETEYKVIQFLSDSPLCTIKEDTTGDSGLDMSDNSATVEFVNEQEMKTICYQVENEDGKSVVPVTFGIDKTDPVITLKGYVGTESIIEGVNNSNYLSKISSLEQRIDQTSWISKENAVLLVSDSLDEGGSGLGQTSCNDPRGYTSFSGKSWRRYKDDWEGRHTFICEAKDNAGNKAETSYIVYRDITPPSVSLKGYIGTKKRLGTIKSNGSNVNSVIKEHLEERTDQSSWVGGKLNSMVLKSSSSDVLSGFDSITCIDPRTGEDDFESWKVISDDETEGEYTFSCNAIDKAGNTASTTYVVKRDITPPSVSLKGYIGTKKRLGTIKSNGSNVNSVIKEHLEERTDQSSWVGGKLNSMVLKSSSSDVLSGFDSITCIDPRTGEDDFESWKVISDDETEGEYTFSCNAIDKAGNTSTTSYTIKRDLTPPKIKDFTNTKNKKCVTPNGYTCYYSHEISAYDYNPNDIDISGLDSAYKYNHCYDNATSSQKNLLCPPDFKSDESKKKENIYPDEEDGKYGYANRAFDGGKQIQGYTYEDLTGNYNLFYKIYDKAGNSVCYRYKLKYTDSNRYTTAVPSYVSKTNHCDDK